MRQLSCPKRLTDSGWHAFTNDRLCRGASQAGRQLALERGQLEADELELCKLLSGRVRRAQGPDGEEAGQHFAAGKTKGFSAHSRGETGIAKTDSSTRVSLHIPTNDHSEASCPGKRAPSGLRLSTTGRGTLQLSRETLQIKNQSANVKVASSNRDSSLARPAVECTPPLVRHHNCPPNPVPEDLLAPRDPPPRAVEVQPKQLGRADQLHKRNQPISWISTS